MNGINYNKMKNFKKNSVKKGQALLLLVMMLATTMTVIMTVVLTTRTETKTTKLEQDSERSFAAAEAGIEAVMRATPQPSPFTFQSLGLPSDNGIDLNKSTVMVEIDPRDYFVSPVIQKDQQYTYYLANYENGTFSNSYLLSRLQIFYGSDTPCDSIALEFTLVSGVGPDYTITKYVADTGRNIVNNVGSNNIGSSLSVAQRINSVDFNCHADIAASPAITDGKLLFIRVLGDNAKTRVATIGSGFPVQGRYITSEAKTTSGVAKKVQLFQSYPQIPADLFLTSF